MLDRRFLTWPVVLFVAVWAALFTMTVGVPGADACVFQPEPAPAEGMSSGPDCVWRFPNGKTYDEMFSEEIDFPLYALLPLALVMPIVVMVPIRAWKPLLKRLMHEAVRSLKYFTPGNPAGG